MRRCFFKARSHALASPCTPWLHAFHTTHATSLLLKLLLYLHRTFPAVLSTLFHPQPLLSALPSKNGQNSTTRPTSSSIYLREHASSSQALLSYAIMLLAVLLLPAPAFPSFPSIFSVRPPRLFLTSRYSQATF